MNLKLDPIPEARFLKFDVSSTIQPTASLHLVRATVKIIPAVKS